MSNTMKDFWEKSHKNSNIRFLSNSKMIDVWTNLNIIDLLKPNIKILNIGVGTGEETNKLFKHDVIIDVLDISEIALNKVKKITRNQYLESNIENLPINEYDIVVSHLVAQHMDDEDIDTQVKCVLRSLSPNGIFAMQFAFIDDNVDNSLNILEKMWSGKNNKERGLMCRTVSEMDSIIKKRDGYISWISEEITFSSMPMKWYYIHIKKINNYE